MTTSADKSLSVLIKKKARELGFDLCGIAPSGTLREHENVIRDWCSEGMNGVMAYLNEDIEKRINPELLFPGAKSIIVTGLNYFTREKQGGSGIPLISRYAYGIDYHDVIKGKLTRFLDYVKELKPDAIGRYFVDSAPVIEKAWAREAGLGWPGRHSILINGNIGSFFFLGVIILNIDLDYDEPFREDNCGSCRLCIDSCPTGAINENRTIDARRCISYLNVENKDPYAEENALKMGGWIFGCDICQEVCPWNKNAKPHTTPEFNLPVEVARMSEEDWKNLTREEFKRLFKRSAIARRTYQRFKRNIEIVTKSGN